jgi:hypothetical protein
LSWKSFNSGPKISLKYNFRLSFLWLIILSILGDMVVLSYFHYYYCYYWYFDTIINIVGILILCEKIFGALFPVDIVKYKFWKLWNVIVYISKNFTLPLLHQTPLEYNFHTGLKLSFIFLLLCFKFSLLLQSESLIIIQIISF